MLVRLFLAQDFCCTRPGLFFFQKRFSIPSHEADLNPESTIIQALVAGSSMPTK